MQMFTPMAECVHSPGGRLFPVHPEGRLYQEFPVRTRNIQSFLCFHSLKTMSNVFNIADITWIRKRSIFFQNNNLFAPPLHPPCVALVPLQALVPSMWTSSMICWPLGVVKGSRLVLISPVFRQTWSLTHSRDRKYTNRQNTTTVTPSAWFSPVHNSHPGRQFQHPATQINQSTHQSKWSSRQIRKCPKEQIYSFVRQSSTLICLMYPAYFNKWSLFS